MHRRIVAWEPIPTLIRVLMNWRSSKPPKMPARRSLIPALLACWLLHGCTTDPSPSGEQASSSSEPTTLRVQQDTDHGNDSATSHAAPEQGRPEQGAESPAPLATIRVNDHAATDNPDRDGWSTEVFGNHVGKQLANVARQIVDGPLNANALSSIGSTEFSGTELRPEARVRMYADQALKVFRFDRPDAEMVPTQRGLDGLAQALEGLHDLVANTSDHLHKFKVVRIERDPAQSTGMARVVLELGGKTETGSVQVHADWSSEWSYDGSPDLPRLTAITLEHYEEVHFTSSSRTIFEECTPSVMRDVACYESQLLRGVHYWSSQIERRLGSDLMGMLGLAIGDVNGDGLDDVYLCQPGGIPDRLLAQTPEGGVQDISASAGVNFLDASRSALLLDLDNDGDQDLVLATTVGLRFLEQSNGIFKPRAMIKSAAKAYTLAACDYDADGLLDIYVCLYHADQSQAVGNPMPYHDANNGPANILIRQTQAWQFAEVTREVGLDVNNRRWSYAAAWEDYDNDGDSDLYVANDFGRNCLYRNDDGHFTDVAAAAGVEDIASGMSVSWGDFDHDGWMDVYVGNMFSAAGGRIAFQRKFKGEASDETKQNIQRLARGNTLFRNLGDGTFRDVTMSAGVYMGRWAWSSPFCDWNNDGNVDLIVCNGHFTGENTKDL